MAGASRRLPELLRTPLGGGLAAALVLFAAWTAAREPRPPQPSADVYTHLTVARHLVRGEGFRTDVTYPLSFAWPFARALPQPLVHRRPGLALLLTAPVATAGGDPARGVAHTRLFMALFLAATAGLGAGALLARSIPLAVAPWLLLVGSNPLLGFGVDWGFEEIPAALLLLVLWLRSDTRGPRPLDGLLVGLLGLLRFELLIVPVLWWGLAGGGRETRRGRLAAVALAVAVLVPWAARDLALTGRPVFLVQAQAELVKDTREWPGYAVYRGLEPQPPGRVLRTAGESVLRKGWRGLRFFRAQAGGLVPWPVAFGAVLAAIALVTGARRRNRAPGAAWSVWSAWGRAGLTLAVLAGLYAFFDHSLRHLLVLVPVLLWEAAKVLASLARFLADRLPAAVGREPVAALLAPALAANLLWLCPSPLPGWHFAAGEATRLAAGTAARAAALAADPATVPFVAAADAPWYADRPAVWQPTDPAVAARIRAWLATP
jgi:hypothetical protein